MCISLFDGRLRFEGDGSSYSGFGCRIEPDDDCCVPPPNVPPDVTPNPLSVTPNPPVNHVDVERDFPQTFSLIAPDGDGSSENAVDAVKEFSADVLAVDSPPDVEILRPDSGEGGCGGEVGEFCAQVCTTEDGVTGSAADMAYTVTLRRGTRRLRRW